LPTRLITVLLLSATLAGLSGCGMGVNVQSVATGSAALNTKTAPELKPALADPLIACLHCAP
jgi:hypothetical protein